MDSWQGNMSDVARTMEELAADFRETIVKDHEEVLMRLAQRWSDEAGELFIKKMTHEQMRIGELYKELEGAALAAEKLNKNHECE